MGASPSRPNNNQKRAGFDANPTVFGRILRGELPAHILFEDELVLCFYDINPVSEFHALVIPKRLIAHSGKVTADDIPLLRHMELEHMGSHSPRPAHRAHREHGGRPTPREYCARRFQRVQLESVAQRRAQCSRAGGPVHRHRVSLEPLGCIPPL